MECSKAYNRGIVQMAAMIATRGALSLLLLASFLSACGGGGSGVLEPPTREETLSAFLGGTLGTAPVRAKVNYTDFECELTPWSTLHPEDEGYDWPVIKRGQFTDVESAHPLIDSTKQVYTFVLNENAEVDAATVMTVTTLQSDVRCNGDLISEGLILTAAWPYDGSPDQDVYDILAERADDDGITPLTEQEIAVEE